MVIGPAPSAAEIRHVIQHQRVVGKHFMGLAAIGGSGTGKMDPQRNGALVGNHQLLRPAKASGCEEQQKHCRESEKPGPSMTFS